MTIDPETLMAYADGELDPLAAKRVEKAIAADAALAEQVARHRALSASLRGAFDPIADAAPPHAVAQRLIDAARVLPFAAPAPSRAERRLWVAAVAASLVVGLIAGPLVLPRAEPGDIAFASGRAVAGGTLAAALDTQLASTQPADAAVRIGVTFRDRTGRLCRSFDRQETAGIACAQDGDWRIERLHGGAGGADRTAYRQAGSAELMRDAQAMMAGEPVDAAQEADALRRR